MVRLQRNNYFKNKHKIYKVKLHKRNIAQLRYEKYLKISVWSNRNHLKKTIYG